ncbi:ribosomal protein L23A [Anaeramoeba ignava]|uniref:Ribosomal protein L23A n=1 Tax=Anaeramoeba ignava TaxID=1746090 RepID=A0A9Q0L774_ANAIG|nr:ribosomal protein L23A [Anaeramoeba ignava]|eukprot:Anaeramoba_ignava/a484504_102.p1 GENE.a484504_102~~a484504_102.p1  ORF type:complete len:160 (+),score=49.34 a484504_102:158-637(+)
MDNKKQVTKKPTKKTTAKKRQVSQAKRVSKGVQKTSFKKKLKPIHQIRFRRPHTLRLPRDPKYIRKARSKLPKLDKFSILKYPLNSETAIKKIEDNNTLVFIVDLKATKKQIARAVEEMHTVKCEKVNTLIRPDGKKKAFVRLPKDVDAFDVANRIGLV